MILFILLSLRAAPYNAFFVGLKLQTDRGVPASLDIRGAEVVHPVGEIHKQENALENPEERSQQWRSYCVGCANLHIYTKLYWRILTAHTVYACNALMRVHLHSSACLDTHWNASIFRTF